MPHAHFLAVSTAKASELCCSRDAGKTTFIHNLFAEFADNLEVKQHAPADGSETPMNQFLADPDSLCTHLPVAVETSSGDWVHYHIQDTPGKTGFASRCWFCYAGQRI